VSGATARLLEAAAQIAGGEQRLAEHLHIGEVLLRAYLEDRRPLPDSLLLKVVDLVLANMESRPPQPLKASPPLPHPPPAKAG
jgi:hypothetical protein